MKLYISALREQVESLEQELHFLHMNPRFALVSEFTRDPEASAAQQLRKTADDCRRAVKGLDQLITVFSRPAPKKEIVEFVKSYLEVTTPRYFAHEELPGDVFF